VVRQQSESFERSKKSVECKEKKKVFEIFGGYDIYDIIVMIY